MLRSAQRVRLEARGRTARAAISSSFETPPSISGLPEIDIKFASRVNRDLRAAPQDEEVE